MLLVCFNPYKDFCDLINYVVWCFGVVASCIWNPQGYVWFPSNLKKNVRERKYKEKVEKKKQWRKIKK